MFWGQGEKLYQECSSHEEVVGYALRTARMTRVINGIVEKILPESNYRQKKYGIRSLRKGTIKAGGDGLCLFGVDTETRNLAIKNFHITGEKGSFYFDDLISIQVSTNLRKTSIFMSFPQGLHNLMLLPSRGYGSAHNLQFDAGAMLGRDVFKFLGAKNEVGGWKGMVSTTPPKFASFRKGMRNIRLVDSLNFFQGRLEKLAQDKTPFLPKKRKPAFIGRDPGSIREHLEFFQYGGVDSKIQWALTKEIYQKHLDRNVPLGFSPASLAFNNFRKNYLDRPLINSNRKNVRELIWNCYHGARTESVGRGYFEDINYYDVNSLYPFACAETPLNFSGVPYHRITLDDLDEGYVGFFKVKFSFPEGTIYPNLPVKPAKLRKMVFPLKGISYCTSHEVKRAIGLGAEVDALDAYGWLPRDEDIDHCMGRFMLDTFRRKKELDRIKAENPALFTDEMMREREGKKLDMNSSYGKYACTINNKKDASSTFREDFAALITGMSRAHLSKLVGDAEAIYYDTDSVMTLKKLRTGGELGELKDELKQKADSLCIRSKCYFTIGHGSETVLKMARHSLQIPTDSEAGPESRKNEIYKIIKSMTKPELKYSRKRLVMLKESVRRKMMPRMQEEREFTFSLKEDGKRVYNENLGNIGELLGNATNSTPLENPLGL